MIIYDVLYDPFELLAVSRCAKLASRLAGWLAVGSTRQSLEKLHAQITALLAAVYVYIQIDHCFCLFHFQHHAQPF